MKIIIIGGFLGAGKTTILLQLAKYLVSVTHSCNSLPVVILENEISENGVDNQLLTRNGFVVENVLAGCICCTSSDLLSNSIKNIEREYHPEWILIEATGMAYPDQIKEVIEKECSKKSSILAVIDTKRFHQIALAMEQFLQAQLRCAQVLFMTKIDKVPQDEIETVKAAVGSYVPDSKIYPVCGIRPQKESFWQRVLQELEE